MKPRYVPYLFCLCSKLASGQRKVFCKGGWPFSTRDIGYLVADCTGEGLKGALICKEWVPTVFLIFTISFSTLLLKFIHKFNCQYLISLDRYSATPISDERIFDAVNILLNMQNTSGGYATIEKTRGSHLLEWFNASEVSLDPVNLVHLYVCIFSFLVITCLWGKSASNWLRLCRSLERLWSTMII